MIHFESEWKIIVTFLNSTQGISTLQKWVEKVVEEYIDIFTLLVKVTLHY